MTRPISLPNLDDLIQEYVSGKSLKVLAHSNRVSRPALCRAFQKRGVNIRGRSEAERLKWADLKSDPIRAAAQYVAAHNAVRGLTRPDSEIIARAVVASASKHKVGMFENEVAAGLRDRGMLVTQQAPVYRYNIDIADTANRIAVEVHSYHPGLPRMAQIRDRTEYLIRSGWNVLFVAINYPHRAFDCGAICDQLISVTKEICRNKSSQCCYGVIRGRGQPSAGRGYQLDNLPRIVGF